MGLPAGRCGACSPQDPKEPFKDSQEGTPRRKQESNFFITLNPNKKFSVLDEPKARKCFETALKHLAETDTLVRYIKFGPKDSHYQSDLARDVLIQGFDWKSTVEVGEELGRMHCHIILGIMHYSQIQIDTAMIRHEFRRAFNECADNSMKLGTLPYCQVKMLPQNDWSTIMRQYLRKGMDTRNV